MSDQVDVGPSVSQPTHHISLTDGTTTLGIILCDRNGNPSNLPISESPAPGMVTKISQGAGGYGDFEQPYTPIMQDDWSGGRGQEDFESDASRYSDAYRADTRQKDIIPGPKETYTMSNPADISGSHNSNWVSLENYPYGVYTKFTATFTGFIRNVRVNFSRSADASELDERYLNALLFSDVNDAPGDVLSSSGSVACPDTAMTNVPFDIQTNLPITSGVSYWLRISGPSFYCSLLYNNAAAGKKIYIGDGTSGLLAINNAELYFVLSGVTKGTNKFFEYRHTMMAVQNSDSQTAPLLYMNGYHLMANVPTSRRESRITLTLGAGAEPLAGGIIIAISGPGSTEDRNWRNISANHQDGAQQVLDVAQPWEMDHTGATEYAIVNLNTWTVVTGHTLSTSVTDILVMDDIIYFAMGEEKTIVRARWSAGAWSFAYEGADSVTGSKASLLKLIPDSSGKQRIWRAMTSTSKASCANAVAWGTNLVFGTEIVCGSTSERITGLIGYGSPMVPWILKEGSFGSIGGTSDTSPGTYAQVPLSEMQAVRGSYNGSAAVQFGVYMLFNLGDGVERYYQGKLDDIGPDRDMGLPDERKGVVRQMISYPTGVFAAVDSNSYVGTPRSSVFFWNQIGWTEIYRGPGWATIQNIAIQNIPGIKCDRLWVSLGSEAIWLPLVMNPRNFGQSYACIEDSSLVSSWISGSMRDITKYWARAKLDSEHLYDLTYVDFYTMVDSDPDWVLQGRFNVSPSQEIVFPSDTVGKRLQYKFVIHQANPYDPPLRIKALLLDVITRIPPNWLWTITFFIADEWTDLNQDELQMTAQAYTQQLKAWADSRIRAAPITMHHNHGIFDDMRVFVEPASIQPIEVVITPNKTIKLIGRMTLRGA